LTSILQIKLRKFVDGLRVALPPQDRARLADGLYKMSIDWLEAAPKRRSKVLREAKSRIIQEFAPPESRRPQISRQGSSHSSLSKTKIVGHLAERVGTPKKTAAMFFDELFNLAVREAKGAAGKFVIPGLGRLVKVHRKARLGRNPQTGEQIKIKAKTVVRLRASKALKDAVLK
jgi:DNA-binding protein HU-beta